MGIIRRVGIAAVAAAVVGVSGAPQAFAADGPPRWPTQTCTVDKGMPHFRTPQAAMVYLAAAWNCHDLTALRHVTTPASRVELQWMTREALDLTLSSCRVDGLPGHHFYSCEFVHHYPKGVPHDDAGPDGLGRAYVQAFPADAPGWYAHEHIGCG
jgi:hypothetical protein